MGGNFSVITNLHIYGEISNSSTADGALTYDLTIADLNYLLIPDIKIGTINLLPLDTTGLNTGDRFFVYNPHPIDIQGIPNGTDNFISSNGLSTLSQGQLAEVVKVSPTDWFAF